jgi:hypothetical protein
VPPSRRESPSKSNADILALCQERNWAAETPSTHADLGAPPSELNFDPPNASRQASGERLKRLESPLIVLIVVVLFSNWPSSSTPDIHQAVRPVSWLPRVSPLIFAGANHRLCLDPTAHNPTDNTRTHIGTTPGRATLSSATLTVRFGREEAAAHRRRKPIDPKSPRDREPLDPPTIYLVLCPSWIIQVTVWAVIGRHCIYHNQRRYKEALIRSQLLHRRSKAVQRHLGSIVVQPPPWRPSQCSPFTWVAHLMRSMRLLA